MFVIMAKEENLHRPGVPWSTGAILDISTGLAHIVIEKRGNELGEGMSQNLSGFLSA